MKNFRPSAVPLITVDPFFSIWSTNDKLYEGATRHWTGRRNPMTAGLLIDKEYYVIMGEERADTDIRTWGFYKVIEQKSLEVTPTRTIYVFGNSMVRVTLTFITPLLLDNLKIMTRPVSYIEYDIEVIDGRPHNIKFYFDISGECCISKRDGYVDFKKTDYSLCCGNSEQKILSYSGDSVAINWGYLHIADTSAEVVAGVNRDGIKTGTQRRLGMEHVEVFDQFPSMAVLKDEMHGVITLAYDDIKAIEYFGDQLDDYYKHYYTSFEEMLKAAVAEYDNVKKLCAEFDEKLQGEAAKLGEKYEKITSLAYRQAIAAHKLVEDKDGNILFLSKECHSNGCIGTVDITYPSIPLFLKYNPELVLGMLRPIIRFAKSDAWEYEFAPHDVGQYPLVRGQVYGFDLHDGIAPIDKQMPVEECGNMLLCMAAAIKYGASRELMDENKGLLKQWADYLIKYGYDPGNQLCTDDFAGHLAHNCNLSLKAILGIAAYGKIFDDESYIKKAREYAKKWEIDAANEKATKLAFDLEDSWSLKYNIIWDKLFNLNLFAGQTFKNEIALYKTKMNAYGIPLDSREDYTKMDWLMWTTVMDDDQAYTDMVIDAIYKFIDETTDRAPMPDWYYTSVPRKATFQNRTVVGGLFINLIQ